MSRACHNTHTHHPIVHALRIPAYMIMSLPTAPDVLHSLREGLLNRPVRGAQLCITGAAVKQQRAICHGADEVWRGLRGEGSSMQLCCQGSGSRVCAAPAAVRVLACPRLRLLLPHTCPQLGVGAHKVRWTMCTGILCNVAAASHGSCWLQASFATLPPGSEARWQHTFSG